jgi:hypothetical protein
MADGVTASSSHAFSAFLCALSGVTISLSALVSIACGLPWDGMLWLLVFLASLLAAILSANRVEGRRGELAHGSTATSL